MTRLLAIVLLLLSFNLCHAQFQWGIRTGFQMSSFNDPSPVGDDGLNWRPKYLVPSLYFQWELNKVFSLSTELSYTSKGRRARAIYFEGRNYVGPTFDGEIVLPYITVPVLLHYQLEKFSFFAGGEFAYKLRSASKAGQSRQENKIFTHPIDIGIAGGVGYKLSDDHTIALRYTHGLVNVTGKEATIGGFGGYPPTSLRDVGVAAMNRTFQLSLSTAFRYASTKERKRKVNFDFRQGIGQYSLFIINDDGISYFENEKEPTYEAAVEMNVQIKKYFQFNTGINYQTKTSETPQTATFKYLSVPLLFGVSPIATNDFRLSVQGGLGVNFMVSEKNGYQPFFGPSDESHNITTSFIYGVEGQIPLSKKLSLLLVYRNSWDNDGPIRMDFHDYKFRGYSVSAGVRYHLNRETEDETPSAQKEIAEGSASRFGVKTGLNFHWLTADTKPAYLVINEKSAMPFWHAGVFYNIRLGNTLSLVPEITYTKRASALPSVDLPVTLSKRIGKKLSLEAGPQMVFYFNKPELASSGPYKLYVSKLTDFGATAGARYAISPNVEISARYFHGLTDTAGLLTDNGEPLSFAAFNRTVMFSSYFTLARKK